MKAAPRRSAQEIQGWLTNRVAQTMKISAEEVDIRTPFTRLGMESVAAVSLATSLADWLGVELPPTTLWDYPNIEALSNHLASQLASKR